MNLSQNLDFLRGIKRADVPVNLGNSIYDYIEIADAVENDPQTLAELGIADDVAQLVAKVKSLAKSKGSSKGKATAQRAAKNKAAKGENRTKATKAKAEKRKPKTEAPKSKSEKDCDCDEKSKKSTRKSDKAPAKQKTTTSNSKADEKKSKSAKAPKATKSDEQLNERLEKVKAEYKQWMAKVENEEKNLDKILALVKPTVKEAGLGKSKIQLEIMRYEADISILKKVYARDARIQKTIMDKAKLALDPSSVKSLAKAIEKAQKLYEAANSADGMSGIRKELNSNPKRKVKKKKSKAKKQEEPEKLTFGQRVRNLFA